MQICYPGRLGLGATPLVRELGGEAKPPKNFLCVVHEKRCDRWEKWTVRLELLPTTLRPTEADTTHRKK